MRVKECRKTFYRARKASAQPRDAAPSRVHRLINHTSLRINKAATSIVTWLVGVYFNAIFSFLDFVVYRDQVHTSNRS